MFLSRLNWLLIFSGCTFIAITVTALKGLLPPRRSGHAVCILRQYNLMMKPSSPVVVPARTVRVLSSSAVSSADDEGAHNNRHQTFALFKPDGYLSQFINNGQIKKRQKMLGELMPTRIIDELEVCSSDNYPLMPIGRLDELSEGLLLLTTDGSLSYHVTKKRVVKKEYYVQVDGIITPEACRGLQVGVPIRVKGVDLTTSPCAVTLLSVSSSILSSLPPRNKPIREARHGPTSWISVIITEGKNRQVRRMTAAVGFPTLRLVRVRIGPVSLYDNDAMMESGSIRRLSNDELDHLWMM